MLNRGGLKVVFFLFIIILVTSGVIAPPKTQENSGDQDLVIEVPILEYQKVNQTFKYHAHVYNRSNGVIFYNADIVYCMIHIYTPTNGGHIIETNMSKDSNLIDMDITVLGGNFSVAGQYANLIYCQVDDDGIPRGGFLEYPIMVTKSGESLTTADSINYTVILIFAFLLFLGSITIFYITPFSDEQNDLGQTIVVNKAKYVKIIFVPISYLFFVWILNLLLGMANQYMNYQIFTGYTEFLFLFFMYLSYPLLTVWFVGMGYQLLKDINKEIDINKFGTSQ